MKVLFIKIYILSVCALLLWSCKKDGTLLIVKDGTNPSLTSSQSSLVLNSADADKEAVTFSWTVPDYGYNAAVKYALQFDRKGNSFATPKEVSITSGLEKTYTVAEFNSLTIVLGLTPGNSDEIEVRVKSDISSFIQPVYSMAITIACTPYMLVIEYPSLYVPGGHQGWAPERAEKIVSVNDDKNYEGYINFTEASTNFKITSAPDWSHTNYGGTSAGNAGTLSTTGSDLLVTGAGYYLLKADLNSNTWTAAKTSWGLIGDATTGGWDSDQDLTYDDANKIWTIALPLTAGSIKFRANDTWDINLGENIPANNHLKYGGENISVGTAGNYKIVLSLSVAGNYTYAVNKL